MARVWCSQRIRDSRDIQAIVEPYVRKALPPEWITKHTMWHVNPTAACMTAVAI
jgi:hypothetical protein